MFYHTSCCGIHVSSAAIFPERSPDIYWYTSDVFELFQTHYMNSTCHEFLRHMSRRALRRRSHLPFLMCTLSWLVHLTRDSDMRPSIVNKNLHFIYETVWPRFSAVMVFFCPLLYSLADYPLLEPDSCHPSSDSISPKTNESVIK